MTDQAERPVRQAVGRARTKPACAIEQGRQERRILPRRQADLRPELRRLPHRQSESSRRRTWSSTTTRRSNFPMPTTSPAPITAWRWITPGASAGPARSARWRNANASRYVRMFQSRRSLLIWKIFGRRTDGWTNDDFPTETVPGDPTTLQHKGKPVANTPANRNRADLDFTGSIMPPPEAVAGDYIGPGRQEDQGRAAHRRRPADAGALDRPRLSDRPRLRSGSTRARGFGWMLRRPAADPDVDLAPGGL